MAALPCYDGDNWLCKYYLQLLRKPLTFDHLVAESIDYVEGNKSRVVNNTSAGGWATAFSNNIMMAGKHYASFELCDSRSFLLAGVMRPGEAMGRATRDPLEAEFYDHFTQRKGSLQYNNTVNCCMYCAFDGYCWSSAWEGISSNRNEWDGMRAFLVLPQLECYLIWMRGHYQYTTMKESWV